MMGLTDIPAFAAQHTDGDRAKAIATLLRADAPYSYSNTAHYAMVKVFVAWWASSLARRLPDGITVNAVSPGSAPATNAAQHQGFIFRTAMALMTPFMGLMGMAHTLDTAILRYFAPIGWGADISGEFHASAPGKMIGPMERMQHTHFADTESQEALWATLVDITGSDVRATLRQASA